MSEEQRREIEDVLLHLASEDKIDLLFRADGEMMASLTSVGEQAAIEAAGGKDIMDVANALTVLFVNVGDAFGNTIQDNEFLPTWLKMIQVARLWKHLQAHDWDDIVESLKTEFPKKET